MPRSGAPSKRPEGDLRAQRLSLGLKQGEFAQRLGVRRETLNRWEQLPPVKRKRRPRWVSPVAVFEQESAAPEPSWGELEAQRRMSEDVLTFRERLEVIPRWH